LRVAHNADGPHQKPSPQQDPPDGLVWYEFQNQKSPGNETNKYDSNEISAAHVVAPCSAIAFSFLLINASYHSSFSVPLRLGGEKVLNPCESVQIRGHDFHSLFAFGLFGSE
jgi:hypothetical protein